MRCRKCINGPRRGATTVEVAFVAIIFLLFLFGIFEYGRFIFFQQLMINAAREGARYAVVNSTDSTMVNDTIAIAKKKMSGFDSKANCTFSVYMSDSTGKNIGNAIDCKFGELIAVQIDGEFHPILPSLLMLNTKIPMTTKSVMASESN
jgi:hypothetical protein